MTFEMTTGRFKAIPKEHGTIKTQTANGDPIIKYVVRLQLTEGPDAGKHVEYDGGFDERYVDHTEKALTAMGWDGKTPPPQAKLTKEVVVTVDKRTYVDKNSGQTKTVYFARYVNAVDDPRAMSGGRLERNRMDSNEEAEFWNRRLGARGSQSSPKVTTEMLANGVGDTSEDDNIPF